MKCWGISSFKTWIVVVLDFLECLVWEYGEDNRQASRSQYQDPCVRIPSSYLIHLGGESILLASSHPSYWLSLHINCCLAYYIYFSNYYFTLWTMTSRCWKTTLRVRAIVAGNPHIINKVPWLKPYLPRKKSYVIRWR